jgi:hypothetical protein
MRRKKALIGIGEMFEGATDSGIRPEQVSRIAAAMGFGSMRLWMHHRDLLYVGADGEPALREDRIALYKCQIEILLKGGVRQLVGMNHCYLYPAGFSASASNVVPPPDSVFYMPFLTLQTKACRLLAETFSAIGYWEIGNEVNADRFLAKPGYPAENTPPEGQGGSEICYTDDEKAAITADICRYSTVGVRAGNKRAKTILPAPAGDASVTAAFIDKLYGLMRGGYREYFDALSCHPYNFDGRSGRIVEYCDAVKAVADRRGDKDVRLFITEYGYYDDDLVKFGLSRSQSDIRQAAYFIGDLKALEEIPYLEALHIFRLFDWLEGCGIEKTFGLFTSPDSDTGIIPKAKGLAVYKWLNGSNADIRRLYQFAKIDVQGDSESNR